MHKTVDLSMTDTDSIFSASTLSEQDLGFLLSCLMQAMANATTKPHQ